MGESKQRPGPKSAERSSERGSEVERGLRGLVGSGPSQVGISGALRARDAARPTETDLAAAEDTVQLVRRNYKPPPSADSSGSSRDRS